MKWGLFGLVGIINISVFIIWIPARMEISPTWIHVNDIWDRIEKSLYLIIDGLLNAYFLYLVRSKLISFGLTKYQALFNFNASIVVVSLSMDLLLIGLMSLPNNFIYVQFHPLAYIVKLNIELTMANLISKITRRKQAINTVNPDSYPTEFTSSSNNQHFESGEGVSSKPGQVSHIYANNGSFNQSANGDMAAPGDDGAIRKTVVTVVRSANKDRSDSLSSSTMELNAVEATDTTDSYHNHRDESYIV
ncbi:hypothetical protein ACMFMG_002294 [Clarireedia jacksonii]